MSRPSDSTAWFGKLRSSPHTRLRLFCFPYAGGSSLIFRQWPQYLPSAIEVCPVHLPMRHNRMHEAAPTRLLTLVESIAHAIRPLLDMPFAFFGHSMGAIISFELARTLRAQGAGEPAHLFASGHRAPQLPNPVLPMYNLPDSELLKEINRLNGTPPEVLEHPELMQLMLPLLRADFEAIETYSYSPAPRLPHHDFRRATGLGSDA